MTQQNMINAFGGESMASMRYRHFGVQAGKEKFGNVARLFEAIAYSEYVHAGHHYYELKHLDGGFTANSGATIGPGNTAKNLKLAIMGETFEITEMYPVYIETAKFQGEKSAQRSFEWSYETEKVHNVMFKNALESVEKGKDIELGKVQICEICGYTIEGDSPDTCPICGAKKDKFKAF